MAVTVAHPFLTLTLTLPDPWNGGPLPTVETVVLNECQNM